MVRAAALALFLLSGCDRLPQSDAERRSVYADVNAGIALKQIDDQRKEIAELKDQAARDRRYLEAVAASLDEARDNHTRLRKTFNDNVDIGNKRDAAQEKDIDWLMRQHQVYRQRN